MGRPTHQKLGAAAGLLLAVAALIISANVYSMCNDEVFVSDTEYITGCISNPGFVSPGEYLYSVRVRPRERPYQQRGSILYVPRKNRQA